jgi:hypothetical protein
MGLNASEAKQRYVDLVARLFSSRWALFICVFLLIDQ